MSQPSLALDAGTTRKGAGRGEEKLRIKKKQGGYKERSSQPKRSSRGPGFNANSVYSPKGRKENVKKRRPP